MDPWAQGSTSSRAGVGGGDALRAPTPPPLRAPTLPGLPPPQVRGNASPQGEPDPRTLLPGQCPALLPHPIQPRPQSIPALSASNLCSERAQPARPGSRTGERNPLPALPSPPPAPEDGLRHWRAAGDRFILQPGLRGRGHSAAFGNRGGRLLGEITALGNRDAPRAWIRPLSLPAQVSPFPDAFWEL